MTLAEQKDTQSTPLLSPQSETNTHPDTQRSSAPEALNWLGLVYLLLASTSHVSLTLVHFLSAKLLNPSRPTRLRRPTAQSQDPQAAASRFILDFEQGFGSVHPEFYQGSYAQALSAAKSQVRIMLAYLQSDEHDDTEAFHRHVLCSDTFLNFLSEKNILIWGGNVSEGEAFQVSHLLSVTKYPFLALIAMVHGQMTVLDRAEGLLNVDQVVQKLSRSCGRVELELAQLRADRMEREQARLIREQQDEAYLASLRADQEKERLAREKREAEEKDKARLLKLEQEAKQAEQERKNRKQKLIETLPAEPGVDEPHCKISIRLPNGERLVRRFKVSDRLEQLVHFIETRELDPNKKFEVINTYPRQVFTDFTQSLDEVKLVPSGSVVVEYL